RRAHRRALHLDSRDEGRRLPSRRGRRLRDRARPRAARDAVRVDRGVLAARRPDRALVVRPKRVVQLGAGPCPAAAPLGSSGAAAPRAGQSAPAIATIAYVSVASTPAPANRYAVR